jgi:hypothetical protein
MASIGGPSTETVSLHKRFGMGNPWLKKNPYLSLWLSGVNAMAGTAQGHARNAARRSATAATRDMSQAMMDAWLAPFTAPKPRRKKRR